MKNNLTKLLIISFTLTTIGFFMDSDVKEPSMTMRFTEYFAMTGMIFAMIFTLYFSVNFTLKKLQKIRS